MTLQELFGSIADAIRTKTGGSEKITPTAFPEKIRSIASEGVAQEFVDSVLEGTTKNVTNTTAGMLTQSAFRGFGSLVSVEMTKATLIGSYGFSGATSLKTVNFPEAHTVEDYAFDNCWALEEVSVPKVRVVGRYGFKLCKGLETIRFETAVSIGLYAFSGCEKLVKVDLAALEKLNPGAFSGCKSLSAVIIRDVSGLDAPPETSAFTGTPIVTGGGYIYVPKAELDRIENELGWAGSYEVRAIEDWPEITGG